ncbi:MAG: tRNA epoxyqueuosine(34) reductase QueG [Clostridia bacterium]|nr:tRNA epoxyqueuosine(34) reductase QueG [Clostridia bacterium]
MALTSIMASWAEEHGVLVGAARVPAEATTSSSKPPYTRIAPGEWRALQEAGARWVICVAVPIKHLPEALPGELRGQSLPTDGEKAPTGVIARYASRQDYHQFIATLLMELKGRLERQVGRPIGGFVSVDNGPLADKRWAFRAGLGHWAPNTLIWTPQYGTWVHLGELAVDVDLPGVVEAVPLPRALMVNGEGQPCSRCGRCVSSCPTGALVEPYALDPERCLSYLTQRRGLVPEDMRPFFEDRLWGCDRCQEACPANPRLALPDDSPPTIKLEPLINLDRKQFQDWLGQTAMNWKGHQVLRRNAAIVLGNRGSSQALPWLKSLAQDPSPVVSAHARWALAAVEAKLGQEQSQA